MDVSSHAEIQPYDKLNGFLITAKDDTSISGGKGTQRDPYILSWNRELSGRKMKKKNQKLAVSKIITDERPFQLIEDGGQVMYNVKRLGGCSNEKKNN